ncbi:MAG: hypothetical protein ACLFNQ_00980 [Spirochaetaceae bacterium]
MSIKHPQTKDFQDRLKRIFDEVDDYLEDRYGEMYDLHPARPSRGETDNKEHSGLFNVGASFTAGYGSEHGRGYVLSIEIATLEDVPDDIEDQIDEEAVEKIRELLPREFPDRELSVTRDGRVFKIHGDLSLGQA